MARSVVVALALSVALAVGGTATAATTLTPANSLPFRFAASSSETFAGTDCGATAVLAKTLPAGATGIRIAAPKVGDRDGGGGTRVTAVSVTGRVVTISVLADGPSICDPAMTDIPPGQPVPWTAKYDLRAEYSRRVQSTIRVHYESYIAKGTRWQARPRVIQDSRAGAPRDQRARFTGIAWTRFGGRKAVGHGTWRQDWCPPGGNCPGDGGPIRLIASTPGYCRDSGRIEYLQLAGYVGRRHWFTLVLRCS